MKLLHKENLTFHIGSAGEVEAKISENLQSLICTGGFAEPQGVILCGGRTPEKLYQKLALAPRGLELQLFLSDERYVPRTHPDSNYAFLRKCLSPILDQKTVYLNGWHTDRSLLVCCQDYAQKIIPFLESGAMKAAILGLGADGHTASIFPSSKIEIPSTTSDALTIATGPGPDGHQRLSLSLEALSKVENIWVLVLGISKLQALERMHALDMSLPLVQLSQIYRKKIEIYTDVSW